MNSDGATPGRAARFGRAVETAALVLLLSALILLASSQIVMRNFFDAGFPWTDELLRILVLWLAMLGALAASRDERQINIDVLSRWLSPASLRVVRTATSWFTAVVCAVAAWASGRFVMDAWQYEDVLLGGLPAWPFQIVLPLGFGLMALRYLSWGWLYASGRRTAKVQT